MKESIQGNITVRISDDEMVAYLDYVRSEVLTEWSDSIILDLLKGAGVVKGFKEFHFPRIYRRIKESGESGSFEIAHGLESQNVDSGKYSFNLRGIPDSLLAVYDKLRDENKDILVYPIEEGQYIGEFESKVPNVVVGSYYVNKGDLIGHINSEGKEREGFTVTGKILEPESAGEKTLFCVSRTVELVDGKLKALKSGFVRKGKNWLDIIPFEGHTFELLPSDDFAEYFLSFTPGCSDAPTPGFSDIMSLFHQIDYPLELLIDEKQILEILNKSIADGKPTRFSLSRKRKSVKKITINNSQTKAVLTLKKGAGVGQKLSLSDVGALIRESKIKGMNLDSIKKSIIEFYKSNKLILNMNILEGKVPTRGEPRRLKYNKEFVDIDKIEGIISRIDSNQQAFYPSFKDFKKEDITGAMIVREGFDFALLTESVPGNDGVDIYGKKIVGLVGNDPIIETYENIIVKHDKYISTIDGILDIGEVDGKTLLRVREHKDMFVDITVSNDSMHASFTFYKETGSGEPISLDFIHRQIDEAGIVRGIDETILEDSFNRYLAGELISEVIFAKGQIPTDKKSSLLKYFEHQGETKFSYEVEKGTSLAQIFPSKESSEDGYDVLGTVMESSGVASLDLKIGDFIDEEKQEDGSIVLKSTSNGEFKVDGNSLTVVDKKVLPSDVTNRTGSIKTLCSLIVKGGVMSSLYVVSGGNVKIMGTVQGALISADKNIIITQGVKGEDKAVLRAKEKVDVKFIENGNIMAVDDVHIRKAALHAKIISNGRVLFDKGGSKIIGGETFSRRGVVVDELGSPSGNKTKISFGQDYLVADKIKVFESDINKMQEDLLKIDQILHKPSGHLSSDKVAHLRKQKVFLMKKLEKKNMKLFLLREKFEEHTKSEIYIRGRVFPGVIFESHGRTLEIMDEEPTCKIRFNPNSGQIEKLII